MNRCPKSETRVYQYKRGSFINVVREVLHFEKDLWQVPHQVSYLDSYLESIEAKTMVVEYDYVDRHFMDEYQRYYASCFIPITSHCTRIHVFGTMFSQRGFHTALRYRKSRSEKKLSGKNSYLGYIVIRPVPSAPIGRTMLKTLGQQYNQDDSRRRHFESVFNQDVHLKGIDLKIEGLPFQQQDQRVGACATTAIWSALSKVSKADGLRTPTPAQITDAAVRSFIPFGRPYPQTGLSVEQICEAIRTVGFSPDIILSRGMHLGLFKIVVATYLRSGIPLILALETPDEKYGHAITACGYLEDLSEKDSFNWSRRKFHSRIVQWNQLYFHDDRLGPYAKGAIAATKVKIDDPTSNQKMEVDAVKLALLKEDENWIVRQVIIPLYYKLRCSASDLVVYGASWMDYLRQFGGIADDDLSFNCRFVRSGGVLTEARDSSLIEKEKVKFLCSLSVSRYVGVVKIYYQNQKMIVFYLDTTDRFVDTDIDSVTRADRNVDLMPPIMGAQFNRQAIETGSMWERLAKILKGKGINCAFK